MLKNHQLKINENAATWDSLGPQLNDIFKLRAEKVAFVKGDDTVVFADVISTNTSPLIRGAAGASDPWPYR